LEDMRLVDYKVRILTPQAGTGAVTRVMIESADGAGRRWTTVGVSPNVIDASFNALHDGITWKLMQEGARVPGTAD
ncbi:MAG TPA: alpha-isopropylmalate synthase regulatory domain-containing protein, partial [Kiloniellales bacterium]